MIEVFLISMCVLAISFYGQARLAARKIRRHRTQSETLPARKLVLEDRGAQWSLVSGRWSGR